jgi:2-methylcitrate dehydratase PrpD
VSKPAPPLAEVIGEWAASLTGGDLPAGVTETAKRHLVDSIGCALAARGFDFAERICRSVSELDDHGALIAIGHGERVGRLSACLVNGALIHGLDYDDTFLPGNVHPSSSVLTATLCAAQETPTSGADFLRAYAAGLEVACRLSLATPGTLVSRGLHPTPIYGAFASAVAVGLVRGMRANELTAAQGFVGSMAAGLMEFIESGAWTNRVHAGWAAYSAQVAVALAASGLPGPARVYEGRYGLFRTHLNDSESEPALARLRDSLESLGRNWQLLDLAIKPFPACHYLQQLAESAIALRQRQVFDADEIERVVCRIDRRQFSMVFEPDDRKKAPQSEYEAQFSGPYVVAAALLRGQFGVTELSTSSVLDPQIRQLAERVEHDHLPASRFPEFHSGEVQVHLTSGAVVSDGNLVNLGSSSRPLTFDQVIAKFEANAATGGYVPVARRLLTHALEIESSDSLDAFFEALGMPVVG